MNKDPSVSVIIPTHNYARFLGEAVRSVFAQTFTDFELIIVDDGSTDETADVVKPFLADRRIRYIYQNKRGPSAARNRGICEAKGRYIALLDADDVWFPLKLEKQIKLFDHSTDIDFVYCRNVMIGEDGSDLPYVSGPFLEKPTYRDLMCFPVTNPSHVVVRKCVFDEVGLFNENIFFNEDADMWMRILKNHRIAYVDEVLVKMRNHSTSARTNLANMENNCLLHVDNCIKTFPELKRYRKWAYFNIYEGLLYMSYIYKQKRNMLIYYLKAGSLRPSFFIKSILIYIRKYLFRKKKFT